MKKIIFTVLIAISFIDTSYSQSAPVYTNHDALKYIDRWQIKSGKFSNDLHSTMRPIGRQSIADFTENIFSNSTKYSSKEKMQLDYLLNDNREWSVSGERFSKKPFLKKMWQYPAEWISVDAKDFTLKINPILDWRYGFQTDSSSKFQTTGDRLFVNGRGLEIRGMISNKLGFYSRVVEYQERSPFFINNYNTYFDAVQGAGRYVPFKNTGVDYRDVRGGIVFTPIKHIEITFAQDKNFIGDGYRSLLLGDASAPYTFLKINTKVWKFQYTNIFTKMVSQFNHDYDKLLLTKYGAFHFLSYNITPKWNIGLFESVIFKRNIFEVSYLNPIILYRAIEHELGSPDNVAMGLTTKFIPKTGNMFYGQILIDDFKFFDLVKQTGWWGNKIGAQAGWKGTDVLQVAGLDMQLEANVVKPYTYSHYDSISNYSHYNQPLAHPRGANFLELFGQVEYQLADKWIANYRFDYIHQGFSNVTNEGENIFIVTNYGDPNTIPREYDNTVAQGYYRDKIYTHQATLTYTPKHNLYFDCMLLYQSTKETSVTSNRNTKNKYISLGMRLNIFDKNTLY